MSPQTNEHELRNVVICLCIRSSVLKKLRTRQSRPLLLMESSTHFVRCGCADELVKPAIVNDSVHRRTPWVNSRARSYVRKVKLVTCTLYSDEFIHEVDLAQSHYSRQIQISLAFKVHWGTRRPPCSKMADGVT